MTHTDIQGYFNARQDGDTHAKSMFAGIDGDTSDTIITDLPAFLKAAGRDYGILRVPAFVADPFGGLDEDGNIVPALREVENQFHLTRTHDGRVVSPHTVTAQYAGLSLMDIAAEVGPWCSQGWVTPDAVYSGKNESLEILSLRLDASGMLPNGEEWEHHIIFRNPHGSGGKCKGSIVSFRQKCSNTFGATGRGIEFVVGHRISAKMTEEQRALEMTARVQRAKDAWKKAHDYIDNLSRRINVWSQAAVSFDQAEKLTNELLGIKDGEDVSKRKENSRDAILDGFSKPEFGTNGVTIYDWLNGVTFYLSSPNSTAVKKSKVSSIERMIRNILPTESGYKLEAKAEAIASRFAKTGK